MNSNTLLLIVLLAVLGLILLIVKFRLHAFIALVLASIFVGLASGLSLPRIGQSFQEGVGAMLGSIAVVVGLGVVLGKLLSVSGGAAVVAGTLINALGPQRLHWTMMLVGVVVGIPVFFTVGMVLLVPVLLTYLGLTRLLVIFLRQLALWQPSSVTQAICQVEHCLLHGCLR